MYESSGGRQRKVVIAGAGVGGLEAALALRDVAGRRVSITLLDPATNFVYAPEATGEPFARRRPQSFPLKSFARQVECELIEERLASVDADAHVVRTEDGSEIWYEKLIVALGATRIAAYEHARTFAGPDDSEAAHGLVRDIEDGYSRRIGFVVPAGVAWTLPLYELALLAAQRAYEMNVNVEMTLITPEAAPMAVFGHAAAAEVRQLLEDAGIAVRCGATAEMPNKSRLILHPGGEQVQVDRVVALPALRGPQISGLPQDFGGFLPIDDFARVGGVKDVYAVGDATNFPLKQGGIACQQADVAAFGIANEAGIPIAVEPLRPVLRGQLVTGAQPRFMRHDVRARDAQPDRVSEHALWWPSTKIAGRYLSPFTASLEDVGDPASLTFVTR